jgi:ABC-type nickel/cobalt efflux system permease component RcnA
VASKRLKVPKTLKSLNEGILIAQGLEWTWEKVRDVIKWYHNRQHHHSVQLTDEQAQHLDNGGALECEYGCGSVLTAQK